jgi:hypothetical protein
MYVKMPAVNMNTVAKPAVSRVRKLPAPDEPNTVLLLPPNTAPMSAPRPCCNKTTPINRKHVIT